LTPLQSSFLLIHSPLALSFDTEVHIPERKTYKSALRANENQQCEGQIELPMVQGHSLIYLFTSTHAVAGPALGPGDRHNDKVLIPLSLRCLKSAQG
jgi:hypothetical protein